MKLQLTRKTYTTNSTIGELLVDGKFQCFTLEDPVRPAKIKGITAIPAGTYNVIISFSSRFKQDMPLLENVPNYEGIRIHPGNFAKDTEGCLLVGKTKAADSVGTSREAYHDLFALLKAELDGGGKVTISIIDGGVSPFAAKAEPVPTTKGSAFRVTADPLRVRSSADSSKSDNVVGRFPFGQVVTSTGADAPAGWVEVEGVVDGEKLKGFVSSSFVEAVPVADTGAAKKSTKGTVSAKDLSPASDAPFVDAKNLYRVNASSLNLRNEPAVLTDESLVASLPRNQLVQKLANTKDAMWWEVATVLNGETVRGFANSGFLIADSDGSPSSVATPAAQPAASPSSGGVSLSEKALQLILDFEGMDQPSKWPGQASGISIGHGYDLGYHTHDEFMGDWGPQLSAEKLNLLATAIGKRGAAAKNIAGNFKGITITKAQADSVFMVSTVPKICGWALKTFPGILGLPLDAQGALTSLVYNRGTAMHGDTPAADDRRKEMRDIRDTVGNSALSTAVKLEQVAASLREMKRHWPKPDNASGHPGIRRRREAEAVLVENAV